MFILLINIGSIVDKQLQKVNLSTEHNREEHAVLTVQTLSLHVTLAHQVLNHVLVVAISTVNSEI